MDDGLIAELAAIADEAAVLERQVRDVAIRAFRALDAVNEAVEKVEDTLPHEASDGVHAAIDAFTGVTRVVELMLAIEDHASAGHLDPGNHPDWLAYEASKTSRYQAWGITK